MAAATLAQHFGAFHEQAAVGPRHDRTRKHLPETRPSGAALELRRRIKQGARASRTDERAASMLVEQRARERAFGRGLAQDGITLRPENLPPPGRRVVH